MDIVLKRFKKNRFMSLPKRSESLRSDSLIIKSLRSDFAAILVTILKRLVFSFSLSEANMDLILLPEDNY